MFIVKSFIIHNHEDMDGREVILNYLITWF